MAINKEQRTGVFPGSFNPFTVGHYSVVERAAKLFDKLYVAIGFNADKNTESSVEKRVDTISKALAGFENVEVVSYRGLTVDFCRQTGAGYIVRGIRSVADFEYERNMADVNRRIGGIETVLLYSLPEHGAVSSSIVRELERYGADVSPFLPPSKSE